MSHVAHKQNRSTYAAKAKQKPTKGSFFWPPRVERNAPQDTDTPRCVADPAGLVIILRTMCCAARSP